MADLLRVLPGGEEDSVSGARRGAEKIQMGAGNPPPLGGLSTDLLEHHGAASARDRSPPVAVAVRE
jgi:hypothetical protein